MKIVMSSSHEKGDEGENSSPGKTFKPVRAKILVERVRKLESSWMGGNPGTRVPHSRFEWVYRQLQGKTL